MAQLNLAMTSASEGEVAIRAERDIVTARQSVREASKRLGFSVIDTTRVVTAASELARNILKYAGTGVMRWRLLEKDAPPGIELCFEDQGPGIPDIEQALLEGYSSAGGLGMGLPGAKRLVDEMEITSAADKGTRVLVRKWGRRFI
jgi:serine/threonine-protein kinase RsbT